MARIPADAGRVNIETAALFRNNSAQLSLIVHGNNHAHEELAGDCAESERAGYVVDRVGPASPLHKKARLANALFCGRFRYLFHSQIELRAHVSGSAA